MVIISGCLVVLLTADYYTLTIHDRVDGLEAEHRDSDQHSRLFIVEIVVSVMQFPAVEEVECIVG